jgi:zinc transporter ZupT
MMSKFTETTLYRHRDLYVTALGIVAAVVATPETGLLSSTQPFANGVQLLASLYLYASALSYLYAIEFGASKATHNSTLWRVVAGLLVCGIPGLVLAVSPLASFVVKVWN